jgi:hypothetical protein
VGAASRSPHTPMQAAAAAAAPQHWAGPKATPSSSREPPRSLLCCLSVACDAMRCTWRATAARQRAAASRQRPKAPSRASAHPAARASAHRSFTWKRRRKRALRGEWWRASAAPRGAFFWMHARGTEADDPNDMHDDRDAVRCLASLSPRCVTDPPCLCRTSERLSLSACVRVGGAQQKVARARGSASTQQRPQRGAVSASHASSARVDSTPVTSPAAASPPRSRRMRVAVKVEAGSSSSGGGGAVVEGSGAGGRRRSRRAAVVETVREREGERVGERGYTRDKQRMRMRNRRQKMALGRWTNPKLARRTCTCEYEL